LGLPLETDLILILLWNRFIIIFFLPVHQQRAMTPPIHTHGHAIASHTPAHSHGATLAVLPISRGLHHQQHNNNNNNHDTSTDRPRSGSTSNMPALTGTGVDSGRTRGHSQSVDVPSNPSHHNSDFSQVRTSGNFNPVQNTSNNGTNVRSTSAGRPQRSTNSVHSEQNSSRSELADSNLQIHGNGNSHSSKQNSSTPQKQQSLHHKIALLKEQETENFQPISRKSSKQAWNENGKEIFFVFSLVDSKNMFSFFFSPLDLVSSSMKLSLHNSNPNTSSNPNNIHYKNSSEGSPYLHSGPSSVKKPIAGVNSGFYMPGIDNGNNLSRPKSGNGLSKSHDSGRKAIVPRM
jgi:hypothetical protein